jgi:hypothetical protein
MIQHIPRMVEKLLHDGRKKMVCIIELRKMVCIIHRIAKDGGVIHRATRIVKNEGKNCLSE